MAEEGSTIDEKTKEKSSKGGTIGGILVVVLLCFWMRSCFSSNDTQRDVKSEVGKQDVSSLDWHKATSKGEVLQRIKDRLVCELAAYGLNASNIVANAKAHPTRFRAGVPEHKRSRWLVLSTNDESVIARKYIEECRERGRLVDEPVAVERVRKIIERLVAVVPEIISVPEIHIFRDDSVNAFCLSDGTVFVNEGTLKKVPDDSLLAAILAHELGHAAARHGNERIAYALIGAAGGVLFEEWVAGVAPALDSGEGVSFIRLAYGIGGDVGFHLPRSRLQESEADRLGVRYLARAGFDPEAMVRLFQWFEAIDSQDSDAFKQLFSDHPLHAERLAHVRVVLRESDLREMPKETWRGKLKKKADEIDFSNAPSAVTNVTSRLPKIPCRRLIELGRKDARKMLAEGESSNETTN